MLCMPLARSSRKHDALPQAETDDAVTVEVAPEAGQARVEAEVVTPSEGVRVPGICPIVVGGEQLVLSSVFLDSPFQDSSPELYVRRPAESKSLATIGRSGHDITCFVKLPGQDAVVTGGKGGEVRRSSRIQPHALSSAAPCAGWGPWVMRGCCSSFAVGAVESEDGGCHMAGRRRRRERPRSSGQCAVRSR